MPERPPIYRPVAEHLPAVYQEEPASWEQLTGYLSALDTLLRAYVAQLEDVTTWLSPNARDVQPPGLPPGAPAADRHRAVFAELASWFAWEFPQSWRVGRDVESQLDRERAFLLRAARLWRRRGTPQGFVDWFCFAFGIEAPVGTEDDDRPLLIEHFKHRPTGDPSGRDEDEDDDADQYALRVTLLVPRTAAFDDYRRRREAVEFVERWLPAHIHGSVCWVLPGEDWRPTSSAEMRELLEELAGYTPEEDGIHVRGEGVDPIPPNRLGQGRLPGTGVRAED